MAVFRELTGSYSDGQRVTPVEYADFFESMGTSFARHPDGAGGPFLYTFKRQGAVVSSVGWAISSAGRRLGTWQLWGLLCEGRALPAATLPLLWRFLRRRDELQRMKTEAEKIGDAFWDEEEIVEWLSKVPREQPREEFRKALRGALLTVYSKYTPAATSIPVEVTPETVDILPWLAVLGPVSRANAQLQPRPFYDAVGYAYALKASGTKIDVPHISSVISNNLDGAIQLLLHDDAGKAWEQAEDVRQLIRRGSAESPIPPPRKPAPVLEVAPGVPEPQRNGGLPDVYVAKEEKPSTFLWEVIVKRLLLYLNAGVPYLAVVLAAWTLWQMTELRNALEKHLAGHVAEMKALRLEITALRPSGGGSGSTTTAEQPPRPLAMRLSVSPPPGIVLEPQLREDLKNPDFDRIRLAATAVEIYMRIEGCRTTSEPVNGRIRDEREHVDRCAKLKQAGLVAANGDLISGRCLEWLETQVPR